jgi:SNF2 family DNA or RNA helicase
MDWKRTAEEATGLTVEDDTHSSRTNDSPETDVLIVSWAKIPTKISSSHYVVIADEAHSMQNMNSARTRDALALMKNAMGVLLLTGTPMKNGKPLNLFPLLKAINHPLGNHQRAYEAHFCGGREVHFGPGRKVWQANGAENLEQLRDLTKSHLLHLTKEDCLKNLPPQTRVTQHVPVSSRSQIQHNQALQKLAKVYENRHENTNQEAILGAVQNLRLVDSLAKVDATVKVAMTVLHEEPAVVIFTSFLQVAKLVHQKLGDAGWQGELLTGETPAKKRQAMVDNFQNGLSPVFVCTFGAGGVGLTLTAASTIILLDRPWTPGDAHQSEARVRRIGQTKPVKSIWMTAFELDKQIDSLIESKARTAVAVLSSKESSTGADGKDPDSSNFVSGEAKLSIFKLLQSVLPPVKKNTLSHSTHGKGSNLTQASILQYSQGSPMVKDS